MNASPGKDTRFQPRKDKLMKQDLMLLWYGLRRAVFAVRLGWRDRLEGKPIKPWREVEDALWDAPDEEQSDAKH